MGGRKCWRGWLAACDLGCLAAGSEQVRVFLLDDLGAVSQPDSKPIKRHPC